MKAIIVMVLKLDGEKAGAQNQKDNENAVPYNGSS